jgi:hypothetical protein
LILTFVGTGSVLEWWLSAALVVAVVIGVTNINCKLSGGLCCSVCRSGDW